MLVHCLFGLSAMPSGYGPPHGSIISLPEEYFSKRLRASRFHFSTVILYLSFIQANCLYPAINYVTIFDYTTSRQTLDGAFSPLNPPSLLRASYLPLLATYNITSCKITMPRISGPSSTQEGRLQNKPKKEAR